MVEAKVAKEKKLSCDSEEKLYKLKRKVVKIAELLERRRLDESKYEGEILCDFVFSKVRKMQSKNDKLE